MITELELQTFLCLPTGREEASLGFLQALFICELMKKKRDSKYEKNNINES